MRPIYLLFVFALADTGSQGTRRQNITPPKALKPGETPVQEPGWKHCVTNLKATGATRKLRSPGYPKLPPTQMQCSWILEAPIGWRVGITFKDLNLSPPVGEGPTKSCQTSYVKIIDVTLQASQGKFCGNSAPGNYVSKGSLLRIDLQGDKSKKKRRGFVVTYTITKAPPGFRVPSKASSPSDSNPGKVDFNTFKSTRQKIINSSPSKKKRPIPKKLVYASETTTQKTTTTSVANEGWEGDAALPKGPVRTPKNGAKINSRRRLNSRKATTSEGNRIQATDQRGNNIKTNNFDGNTGAGESDDVGWIGEDGDSRGVSDESGPRYYGQNSQPQQPEQNDMTEDSQENPSGGLVVVHSRDGVSTTQLIIIVAGVMGCIALLVLIFFIKRLYLNKKSDDEEKHPVEGEIPQIRNSNTINHESLLPGLAPAELPPFDHRDPGSIKKMSGHPSLAPGVFDEPISSSGKTRHQSLVAKHDAIYRNHNAMIKNARRHPSATRFTSKNKNRPNLNRPLPPVPKGKKNPEAVDEDEDYWSGSQDDPDLAPMRRELSQWEIKEQNKNRNRNKYL